MYIVYVLLDLLIKLHYITKNSTYHKSKPVYTCSVPVRYNPVMGRTERAREDQSSSECSDYILDLSHLYFVLTLLIANLRYAFCMYM